MKPHFSPSQWVGFSLLILLLSLVVIENLVYGGDPAQQDLSQALATPTWDEPLGRDHYGRSNFARLSSAIATSFAMAVACVFSSALLGLITGIVAAWKGGWWDKSFSWLLNMLLAMPGLILVLLFGAMVPGSFFILYLAIALMLWVEFFRVVRSKTLSLLEQPQIEASRLYGFSAWYLFRRHLWPELREDLFTLGCFGAGNAILALASIGFLYVGLKPPQAELGMMMVELFRYYHQAPWVLAQPILVVFTLVLSFQLLAKGRIS
ncbi:ABC transporter permease [Vibrio mimicus]|uniref:ABC transporter permease n=1 Tax=Vibrio mimicus TaxID=674 RepID=UPI00076B2510|nr:ABC transporter permease [Vibrio mimicus]AMG01690.1 ABC transporter permease [Vibrio mimicus]KAA3492837.1 ABC transporter permease [Vibrio mimicus]TXY14566.1 ABC transporter permease [Vibrio mimicus]TXY25943.1 ABC transporter permease [Vibrio mimicus]TXZ07273.1 ABC transporter permease [Vibrio mimicus]